MAENAAGKQRGKPFLPGKSGNPAGKPKGTRNATTKALEALLDGQAEKITQRAVDLALTGDQAMIRVCMDRLLPVRRDRPITFALPPIEKAADAVKALGAVVSAVANGDLTPTEAAEISKMIDSVTRAIEVSDLSDRIARLEQQETGR